MTLRTIDLQRRRPGPRAEALLDQLQSSVAGRLTELGDDWADHIAIL